MTNRVWRKSGIRRDRPPGGLQLKICLSVMLIVTPLMIRTLAARAQTVPTFIQGIGSHYQDQAGLGPMPLDAGPITLNAVAAGDVLVVAMSGLPSADTSIGDSLGTSFSRETSGLWVGVLQSSGTDSITGNSYRTTGGWHETDLWAGEYRGVNPIQPVRSKASQTSSPASSGPLSPTVQGDLMVGMMAVNSYTATPYTPSNPFILRYNTQASWAVNMMETADAVVGPSQASFAYTFAADVEAVELAAAAPGPPGQPTANAQQDAVSLSWSPPTDDGGSPVIQYEVTAHTGTTGSQITYSTGSALPTFVFPGLTPGVTYTFVVAAETALAVGQPSTPSNPVLPAGPAPDSGTVGNFSYGELQEQAAGVPVCGPNADGEPSIHISQDGNVYMASERGLGNGSDIWRGVGLGGGAGARGCTLQYASQPNAVSGAGAAGFDVDLAVGSQTASTGAYPVYVSSSNGGSVSVAHSTDTGASFINVPVQGGLPIDDRPWIAAYGPTTSLLSFHDVAGDIDVLRSDDGGVTYTEISQAIAGSDYKATNNEIGNLVIDHRNSAGTVSHIGALQGFWAYQAFVAPSASTTVASGSTNNELFVAVSNDGGFDWTDQPVVCSVPNDPNAPGNIFGLNHKWPVLSLDPAGDLWAAWSDGINVGTAKSTDHGMTWTCSTVVSITTGQAIEPWLVATSSGVDLVYYATPTAVGGNTSSETWSVSFLQNLTGGTAGWGTSQQLMAVHTGPVCLQGAIACSGGRQLFEDFGLDTDRSGWAHIAYSHDAPSVGGSGTYTGYAVQTGGSAIGYPN